jgi:membrane-bound lytic murein transglycosylase B
MAGTKYSFVVLLSLLFSFAAAAEQAPFNDWLAELKNEAIVKGIDSSVVDATLGKAKYLERVIQADRSQAEFTESYQQYINKRLSSWRVEKGQAYLEEHAQGLAEVQEFYGVPARYIAAIIGVETNYGTFKLKHSLFDVLVTLAYDARRGERFRKEIFAALQVLDGKQVADITNMKSSWAGAIGIPQFMPSTFLRFAVDFDQNGDKDIWNHGPDLWASVAFYLSHYGWKPQQTWGRKADFPKSLLGKLEADKTNKADIPAACQRYKKHLVAWRSLAEWNDMNVRKLNGMDLPDVDMNASYIVTEPNDPQAYLVYENFCTFMRYNPSFKYALTVGALADAISQ